MGILHQIPSFFRKNKILIGSFVFLTLYGGALFAIAAGGPFTPHQTLDPDCLPTNGTCYVSGGTGSPASPLNSIQYNNGGSFYGDPFFTRDPSNGDTIIGKNFGGNEIGGFNINTAKDSVSQMYSNNSTGERAQVVTSGGPIGATISYEDGAHVIGEMDFNSKGNLLTWNPNTSGTVLSGLEQSQNILGLGKMSGSFNTYKDTATHLVALSGAGDLTSSGGDPAQSAMATLNTATGDSAGFSTDYNPNLSEMAGSGFVQNGTKVSFLNLNSTDSTLGFSPDNGTTKSAFAAKSDSAVIGFTNGPNTYAAALGNGTFLIQDATLSKNYFKVDILNKLYQLGDINGGGNGTLLLLDDANKAITLNANYGNNLSGGFTAGGSAFLTFPGAGIKVTDSGTGNLGFSGVVDESSIGRSKTTAGFGDFANGGSGAFSTAYAAGSQVGFNATDASTFQYGVTLDSFGLTFSNQNSGQHYSFPTGNGTGVLTNNGSGVLSWVPSSTGGVLVDSTYNNVYTPSIGAGQNLNGLGGGVSNILLGHNAGSSVSTGVQNTFIGDSAGVSDTSGSNNTFLGVATGVMNTTGHANIFSGVTVGYFNTTGNYNIFSGTYAGYNNTTGSNNVFIGQSSGQNLQTVDNQIGIGFGALQGSLALASNTGGQNIAIGSQAGYSNSTGSGNLFIGEAAGFANTTGIENVFLGLNAGQTNSTGSDNIFTGIAAGNQSNGSNNIFTGRYAGGNSTSGGNNVFMGYYAGSINVNGSNNVFIGAQAGGASPTVSNLSNAIAIGYQAQVAQSNSFILGGTGANQVSVGIGTTAPSYLLDVGNNSISGAVAQFTNSNGSCTINPTGGSVSCSSDSRLKKNVVNLDSSDVLAKVLEVQGVTYNWNGEQDTDPKHIGFIAQNLETIFPEFVSTDAKGMKSVAYGSLTPVLVEAIKALDVKIQPLNDLLSDNNTFANTLRTFLASAMNGVTDIFAQHVHTDELCVGTTCVTQDQFLHMVQNSNASTSTTSSGDYSPVTITSGSSTTTNTSTSDGTTGTSGSTATTSTGTSSTTSSTASGATTTDSTTSTGTSGGTISGTTTTTDSSGISGATSTTTTSGDTTGGATTNTSTISTTGDATTTTNSSSTGATSTGGQSVDTGTTTSTGNTDSGTTTSTGNAGNTQANQGDTGGTGTPAH